MPVCFFIGHRDAPDELFPILTEAVERHITGYGVEDFVVGHYGRFDHMAANAVISVKKRHPQVTLTLLLPYHPYEQPLKTSRHFDGTFYPPGMEAVPRRAAIVRANLYMVQNCDYLIAYDCGHIGNTREFTAAAKRRARKGLIHVENLAERIRRGD